MQNRGWAVRISLTSSWLELSERRFHIKDRQAEEITKILQQELLSLLSLFIMLSVYNALIMPDFDYCCEVWNSLGSVFTKRLQKGHSRYDRVIMRCKIEAGLSELVLRHLASYSRKYPSTRNGNLENQKFSRIKAESGRKQEKSLT